MDAEPTRPTLAPTGDPRVDQAIEVLSDLDQMDLDARPAVLEQVHDRLREILGELGDAGRQAHSVAPAGAGGGAAGTSARPGQPAWAVRAEWARRGLARTESGADAD